MGDRKGENIYSPSSSNDHNMNSKIKELKEIKVMYLSTPGGPREAPKLFFQLEKLVGLKGRKFYGVFWQNTGEYWAATKIKKTDNQSLLRFKTGIIPGGLYVCEILEGRYQDLVKAIGPTFKRLSQQYPVDFQRPSIECYKRFTEFVLYLPITNLVK